MFQYRRGNVIGFATNDIISIRAEIFKCDLQKNVIFCTDVVEITSLSSSVGYSSFKILWCSHSFAIFRNIETRCNEYFGGIDAKWTLGGLNRSSILLLFPERLSKSIFNFYSRTWFSFADHMVSELAIRSNSGAYRNNWNRGIQQLKI